MITAVRLQNWRAYSSFELNLAAGTTFLVARNGVGKTSLIDAVRWALEPSRPALASMLRDGSSTASVDVELIVGSSSVRIKRSLKKGKGKNPHATIDTWIDGMPAEETAVFRLLTTEWAADNGFLVRAAFVTGRLLFADDEPDLRAHLRNVFGLDHLQDAISRLTPAIAELKKATDAARAEARDTESELAAAESAVQSSAATLDLATAREPNLRVEATTAAQALAAAQRADADSERYTEWQSERDAILAAALPVIGSVPVGASIQVILRSAEAAASQQLEQLREARAQLSGRIAAVDDALARLREAGGDCPVCRRPLDDESRENAEHEHQRDHRATQEQFEAIDVDGPSTVAATLRDLVRRSERLGDEPARPDPVLLPVSEQESQTRMASEALETTVADIREARVHHVEAVRVRDALRIDVGIQSRIPSLFRQHGTLEAAKVALERTITEVLETELGPVAADVNRRWDNLFSDRPGLRFDSRGNITRSLADTDLDFASFSSGEQMVAKLLLRLSTLIKTTKAPFCWIDEPLEHLDPDARRFVAQSLAYMSKYDSLDQIVVTTYEESLARKLAERDSDHVHLEYLLTAPVTA